MFQVSGFMNNKNNQLYSSHNERVQGLSASLKLAEALGLHTISYHLHHRENTLLPNASFAMRQDAGHSLKSSISHSYTMDTRDDKTIPTKGALFKISEVICKGWDWNCL